MSSPTPSAADAAIDRARGLAADRRWAELANLAGHLPPDEVARQPELAYLLGDACRRTGRIEEAVRLADDARRGALTRLDARLTLRVTNLLGMIAFESGRVADAQIHFETLLDRSSEWGDEEFAARAANNLGVLANVRGDRELASTSYQRALAAYHRLGHARGLAQTHYNLGISFRDLGFSEQADSHYSSAIRFAEQAGSEDVIALAETERAYLLVRAGDADLAESLGRRALTRLEAMHDPAGSANAIRLLAEAAAVRGDLDLAGERLDSALDILIRHPDPLLRAEIQRDRGRRFLRLGEVESARAVLDDAMETFRAIGAQAELDATRAILDTI